MRRPRWPPGWTGPSVAQGATATLIGSEIDRDAGEIEVLIQG